MTAALACLRGPFERSVAEGPYTARFEALALRARELLNSAHYLELEHLERITVRLETDMEMLIEEAGGAMHRKPKPRRVSASAAGLPEGS